MQQGYDPEGNHFGNYAVNGSISNFAPQFVCFFFARQPPVGQGLIIHEVSRSHTTTHHTRLDSSGRVISSSQRPILDNTKHSQQTNVHADGVIRTHNLSRRVAADLHLRPRGHWDRLSTINKPQLTRV